MPALFSIQPHNNSYPKEEVPATESLEAKDLLDIEKGLSTENATTSKVENTNEQITSMSASQSTFIQQLEDGIKADPTRQGKPNTCNSPKNHPSVTSSPASSCHSSSMHVSGDGTRVLPALTNNIHSKMILIALIVLLGAAASAAFMSFGFHTTNKDMQGRFESQAEGITYHILSAWTTYETFALWIHQACHKRVERDYDIDPYEDIASHLGYCSRSEFRRLYEYIDSQGADFLSAQLLKVITHNVRDAFEQESREYYNSNYPRVNYRGITEQVFRPEGGFDLAYRDQREYYMPIHYVEPVDGNEVIIDLDKMAGEYLLRTGDQSKSVKVV
jgi:CHASE domain